MYMRVLTSSLVALAIFTISLVGQVYGQPPSQTVTQTQTTQAPAQPSSQVPALPQARQKLGGTDPTARISREVMHELLMNPNYSVFDDLAFSVQGNTVTLSGQRSGSEPDGKAGRAGLGSAHRGGRARGGQHPAAAAIIE